MNEFPCVAARGALSRSNLLCRLVQLFERARKMAPCIVFIDEAGLLRISDPGAHALHTGPWDALQPAKSVAIHLLSLVAYWWCPEVIRGVPHNSCPCCALAPLSEIDALRARSNNLMGMAGGNQEARLSCHGIKIYCTGSAV